MSALQERYQDLHEFDGPQAYVIPNEETLNWRELLKSLPVHRAAGICSSGEVGLFGMLPSIRQELVLVDHSYRSLAIAMMKYLLIRDHGWQGAYKIVVSGDEDVLRKTFEPLVEELPERVRTSYVGRYYTLHENAVTLKREWEKTPVKLIQKAHKKLDKVRFVHGDLTDLAAMGPFGLLYLSNALEHYSRTRRRPLIEEIEKVVKPGGYVIACGSHAPGDWETIRSIHETGHLRNPSYIRWTQTLYRIPKRDELLAAA